jgi:hypothetical protein
MLKTAQLLRSLFPILITIVAQSIQFLRLALSSRAALSAEVVPEGCQIKTKDVRGGLHHEYWLEKVVSLEFRPSFCGPRRYRYLMPILERACGRLRTRAHAGTSYDKTTQPAPL